MERRQLLVAVVMLVGIAATSLLLGRRGTPAPLHTVEPSARVASGSLGRLPVPEEVTRFLKNGQSWRAAREMRRYLAQRADAPAEAVLLAARAEAGWGGWDRVRGYLEGADWLDGVQGGEGWYWLGRALEADEEWEGALRAYGRYLAVAPAEGAGDLPVVAGLRRGLILLRQAQAEEGAALLEGLRAHAPELEPWIDLLAAEALAESGDTARVHALLDGPAEPELWLRGRRALVRAHERARDPARARALALAFRDQAGAAAARAEFSHLAGRFALQTADTAAAREDLRAAVREAPTSSAARGAADLLVELGRLRTDDRLAIARVYDRHGADALAARYYRAWLEANDAAGDRNEVRLALGRALFDAGQYAAAAEALAPLREAGGDAGAEALYLIGRSEYRRGNRERALGVWEELARRHPGHAAGAEGLFLVADLSHDAGETGRAATLYRRVASGFRGTDRAGLSLMRLGGLAFLRKEFPEAARVWEEYRATYPAGERWLQATYWAGRAYEATGDTARARERYRAVRAREPRSYYALQAAQRVGEPFWPVPTSPSPLESPAARERVEGWMHGLDLLRAAGLHEEAELEADRWIRRAGDDPALLYPLAEALNERGLTVRGIRLGQRLERSTNPPSERLLRILFPFPYRAMIEAEAREKELDPFLVAALTRQESLFKARITSAAGARGLMQIMPETGQVLARGADIGEWDAELLYQPEINVHLGTRYLADQMRRYDASLPAVFSAYNAGPHRIDRWMEFPEYRDRELFTERIPYRETREYVKILTRNIALYRALYD